jgi:aryl-alcohol dehydrogenase-like predicted oxidoreductase
MTLPRRRPPGTDLDVSVLCYGPMRIATDPADPGRAGHERAMRAAIDHGIDLIHSSYEYGVRWLMQGVLRDHPARHDLHHVIKVPVPDWDDGDFDAAKYEARVDEALRDLCCERIALIQWMWRIRPDDEAHRLPLLARIRDRVRETHERLRAKGKVAHLACFPYYPESAEGAMADRAIAVLIAYHNLVETEMGPLVERLATEDRGFLAIRPLYQGVLTDRYADRTALPEGHRLRSPKLDAVFARRDAIAEAVGIAPGGMTAFALRFPLLSPNCASVIVGLNSEAQAAEAVRLVEGVTPDPTLAARIRAV